jgi:nitroimidazol reductase NimA-like FMN-containing flavoprotein (pyridoxamine 5'-phosphate oxidase superfamily)
MTSLNPDKLTRLKHKQVENQDEINNFLDTQRFGYLALVDDSGQPVIIPIAYARLDGSIVIHGSTGAGALSSLKPTTKVCFNITRINGLVLARSSFESSVHYESVNIFGTCTRVEDEEKIRLLTRLSDRLFPQRTDSLRPMTSKEIAATLVVKISMDHVIAKRSDGQPTDEGDDINWPVWAGILPIEQHFGAPIPAENLDPQFAELPSYLENWEV